MESILAVICLALSVTDASLKPKPVITWELLTNPVRFGGMLILNCTTSYQEKCSGEIHRIWTNGNDNDLISNNGVLGKKYANRSKYFEQTSDSCRHSSLIVRDVNENDFNIPYTCSFGYPGKNNTSIWVSKTDLLSLNNTEYEYYPAQNMIESWEIRKGGRSKFFAHIKKIYPVPSCVIYIQGQYQPDLNIKTNKNGLFFSVDMFTDYLIGDYLPTKDWCIHCTINDLDFSIMNNGSKSLVCGVAKEDPLVIKEVVFGLLYMILLLINFLDDVYFQRWKCDNFAKTVMTVIWFIVFVTDVCLIPHCLSYSGYSKQGYQSTARWEQTTEIVTTIVSTFHFAYIAYKFVALRSLNEIGRTKMIFVMAKLHLRIAFTFALHMTTMGYIPKTTLGHVFQGSSILLTFENYIQVNRLEEYRTKENSKKDDKINEGSDREETTSFIQPNSEPVVCNDIATSSNSDEEQTYGTGETQYTVADVHNEDNISNQSEDDYNRDNHQNEDSATVTSDDTAGNKN